ncbi:hypothetical protein BH20ACI2_BH20ACI2_24830 [soil metagenome]
MNKPRYRSEAELAEILRKFEDATIGREDWKHAEHMVVALFYLSDNDFETAKDKMRSDILNLLVRGFDVDMTKEMPYHETITVFWMKLVSAYLARTNGGSLLDKAKELAALYDKDYPLTFYSRELLFSDRARREFVEPDLQQQ